MSKQFAKSISITALIVLPMFLTNTTLQYLDNNNHSQELLILILMGVGLLIIGYFFALKPLFVKYRRPKKTNR